jgi:hypothetical protein
LMQTHAFLTILKIWFRYRLSICFLHLFIFMTGHSLCPFLCSLSMATYT